MTVQSFHSDDVDEAMIIFGQKFYDHRIIQASSAPLGFNLLSESVSGLNVGMIRYGQEVAAQSTGDRCSIAVPLKGAFRFRLGGIPTLADPSTAAISTATVPVHVTGWTEPDDAIFILSVDPQRLALHLRQLLGRGTTVPLRFSPSVDLRAGCGAQWWQVAQTLLPVLDATSGPGMHPMTSAPLAGAVMTGLLLAADHPYRDALDALTRRISPGAIRMAKDFIEQHAHEPITVVEVAAEVGSSLRALNVSFKAQLNVTPVEYLRAVRLRRVHAALRGADPETATVSEIARSWGFNHRGRFSAQYRGMYNVLPSVTLRD